MARPTSRVRQRITLKSYDHRYHERIRLYIKVQRALPHYDRQEVADLANVSYQCVANYEYGAVELPHAASLRRVAYALGIHLPENVKL